MGKVTDMDEILKGVLPSAEPEVKNVKVSWSGLDRVHSIGSGTLYDCENTSVYYSPYLSVSEKPFEVTKVPVLGYPLSLHSYEDMVVVSSINYGFYIDGENTWAASGELKDGKYAFALNYEIIIYRPSDDKIFTVKKENDSGFTNFALTYYPGTPSLPHMITADEVQNLYKNCAAYLDSVRDDIDISVTGFQFYSGTENKLPVTGTPSKRLIFGLANNVANTVNRTERRIYSADLKQADIYASNEITATDGLPPIRFLATHQGRVWGAKNTVVSASSYANYANWETDLSYITNETDGYGAAHAWVSSLQSDSYSSGDVTGIYNFLGNLIVFRKDYMFEISGTKNPFRVNDIINKGTIDGKSVAACGGILFFAGSDGVYAYTGNIPECISGNLDIRTLKKAVATADDRCYYLYAEAIRNSGDTEKKLYVYDTYENAWSIRSLPNYDNLEICGLARVGGGVYALSKTIDANGFSDDIITNGTVVDVDVYRGKLYKLDTLQYSGNQWFADTEIMAADTGGSVSANPKRIKEIRLIAELSGGATLKIFVSKADEIITPDTAVSKKYENNGTNVLRFPIVLKIFGRSGYGYKIRLAGTGFARIYSMEVLYADGGAYTKTDKDGIAKA